MALKKLIQIDESFPVMKRARLGAAPPIEDVLDNVGTPEVPAVQAAQPVTTEHEATPEPKSDEAPKNKPARKREASAKRVGQGVHKGSGIDARRYRKTGRTYQFGARVRPEFAEQLKVLAADKNVTIGELLEAMYDAYTEK
ncbi:MAG: hypothetical protein ABL901_17880 [Hyphomicrobiaceae bacterium]